MARKQIIIDGKPVNLYVWPTGKCETYNGVEVHPIYDGRPYISWHMYGAHVRNRLDQIVATAFLERPEDAVRLVHMNGDERDCSVDNLYWLTRSEIVEKYKSEYGLTEDRVLYNEEWREIETIRGVIEVSSFGNVREQGSHHPIPVYDSHGYKVITFWYRPSKSTKTIGIHRLVAQAFIPNPEGFTLVNHLDCDKSNNHVYNLEWCSAIMNSEHAVTNIKPHRIPREAIERTIALMNEGRMTDVEISKETGVSRKYISAIRHGKTRKDVDMRPTSRYKSWCPDTKYRIIELIKQGKSRSEILSELGLGMEQAAISYYERARREYLNQK